MSKINNNTILELVKQHLEINHFTIKAVIAAALTMILPVIYPFAGITLLVFLDFYVSYNGSKLLGKTLLSDGIKQTLKKWTEYLVVVVACVVGDAILIGTMPNMWSSYLTNVALVAMVFIEMKSISENMGNAKAKKVFKILWKFISVKLTGENSSFSDILAEEVGEDKIRESKRNKYDFKNYEKKD